MDSMIEGFEKLLSSGTDSAVLRFSLGNAYFKKAAWERAIEHLAKAVEMDPDYSAAWKIYAKALAECGKLDVAAQAYRAGIEVAERKGDVQAAKEMRVFLKRLEKR